MAKDKKQEKAKEAKDVKPREKNGSSSLFKLLSRFSVGTAGFVLFSFLVVLVICFSISYSDTMNYMGAGCAQYDGELYTSMENVISKYTSEITPESGGADIVAIRDNVDDYFVKPTENGTVITCWMFNGYFEAEEEFVFDSNFALIGKTKNFDSLNDYLNSYWNDFRSRIFIGTIVFGTIGEFVLLLAIFLLAILVSFLEKKKHDTKQDAKDTATPPVGNDSKGLTGIDRLQATGFGKKDLEQSAPTPPQH